MDRFRFGSELEEDRQVDVSRGCQYDGVSQTDHPRVIFSTKKLDSFTFENSCLNLI